MKTRIKNLLIHKVYWVAMAALLLVGVSVVGIVRAYSGGSPKVVIENGNYYEADGDEEVLGGTGNPTNLNDFQVDYLTVAATSSFSGAASFSGAVTISGTSTLGYTPNQVNVPQVSMNAATTTNCAVQNTSGVDRVINATYINVNAGSSANTANASWRGYVSDSRAAMNPAATSTLFTVANLPSSTRAVSYGGPVPSSYYTSSTAFLTGVSGIATTTLVFWPNGWWANVTSSAITTSTGNCVFSSFPF